MSVSGRSRVRASFDALLYRAEQGRWVNFTGGDIRDRECTCKVQLLENETGYVVNCKHDGQVNLGACVQFLIVTFYTR